jgi:hypothetical protein
LAPILSQKLRVSQFLVEDIPMRKLALSIAIASRLLLTYNAATGQTDGGDASGDANCANNPCLVTYHNNNARNGVNSHETILVANNFPSNFTATTPVQVDRMIYAQPLYAYGVPWAGSTNCSAGTLNMVYVATENNTLYAIEADSPYNTCQSLSLNNPSGPNADTSIPVTALPGPGGPCNNLTGSMTYGTVGVTGTPVIDPNHNTLFVVSSHQSVSTPYTYTERLNAVDITKLTLVNYLDIPTAVNAAKPSGYPTFYTLNESQRSGVLLTKIGTNGVNIFVAWGSFCDSNISAGGSFGLLSEFDWSYPNLQFSNVAENFYPEGTSTNISWSPLAPAGVWMSGGAPAADAGGNVYAAVGNGNFEGVSTPLNFGNSIVKLGSSSLTEEDFYTPNVWPILNTGTKVGQPVSCGGTCTTSLPMGDWDLGSGGTVILTSSSATQYGELVAAGKEGMFYVTYFCSSSTNCPPTNNWNQLMGGLDGGGYGTGSASNPFNYACTPVATPMTPAPGNIAQCFYGVQVQPLQSESGQRATAAFWPNGTTPYLYTVGTTDVLKGRSFNTTTGVFTDPADATGAPPSGGTFGYPGASPTITSNGTNFDTAVVWVLDTSGFHNASNHRAILTAYAAKPNTSGSCLPYNLCQLWTSGTTTGPGSTKFMVPTVANGKVYVAGQSANGCGSSCPGLLVIYHQ